MEIHSIITSFLLFIHPQKTEKTAASKTWTWTLDPGSGPWTLNPDPVPGP